MGSVLPSPVALAVCAYCAWQSRDLVGAWRNAPFDRLAWLVLAAWCAPIVWRRCRPRESGESSVLLALGVTCALLGTLGSINAIKYLGLALALAGLLPWAWAHIVWIASSAAWMPAFGWLVGRHCPDWVLVARLSVVIPSILAMVVTMRPSATIRGTEQPLVE